MAGDAAVSEWFHGSPHRLSTLLAGSTITRDRALAKAFSHKPSLVSDGRDGSSGSLRHNGRGEGWLHVVDEPIVEGDVIPLPGSTLPGKEWQTTRPLQVVAIERTIVRGDELLSAEEEVRLRSLAETQRTLPPAVDASREH